MRALARGLYLNRLLLMFGLSSLFLAAFYSVGLMVSACCHSTRTAIVALLVVWVVLQLVIPKTGEMVAAVAVSAPSQESVRIDKAKAAEELEDEMRSQSGTIFTRTTGWTSMNGPDGRSAFEMLSSGEPPAERFREEYQALSADYQQQIRDRLRQVDQAYEQAKARQQQVSRSIALLSPAAALTFLVTDLAGTGDASYATYREAVGDHYQIIDQELFSRSRARRYSVQVGGSSFSSSFPSDDDDAPEASDMPVFQAEAPGIGAVMGEHAWAIGTLLVYLIVPFLVAYVAFLRYDVR
ncbi:MAG: ABC transporter permease subunit [Bacteroidota bacterium]